MSKPDEDERGRRRAALAQARGNPAEMRRALKGERPSAEEARANAVESLAYHIVEVTGVELERARADAEIMTPEVGDGA